MEKRELFRDSARLEALLALIDGQRKHLQDNAWVLGERLFAPKPQQVLTLLGKHWRLWDKARR